MVKAVLGWEDQTVFSAVGMHRVSLSPLTMFVSFPAGNTDWQELKVPFPRLCSAPSSQVRIGKVYGTAFHFAMEIAVCAWAQTPDVASTRAPGALCRVPGSCLASDPEQEELSRTRPLRVSVLQFLLLKHESELCCGRRRSFLRAGLFASRCLGKSPTEPEPLGAPLPWFAGGSGRAPLPTWAARRRRWLCCRTAMGVETSFVEHHRLLQHVSPLPPGPAAFWPSLFCWRGGKLAGL